MIIAGAESSILCSGCAVGCSARILSVSADVIRGGGTYMSSLMALKRSLLFTSLETLSATCVAFVGNLSFDETNSKASVLPHTVSRKTSQC